MAQYGEVSSAHARIGACRARHFSRFHHHAPEQRLGSDFRIGRKVKPVVDPSRVFRGKEIEQEGGFSDPSVRPHGNTTATPTATGEISSVEDTDGADVDGLVGSAQVGES